VGLHVKSVFLLVWLCSSDAMAGSLPLQQLSLPAGFKIDLYSGDVPDARSMTLSPTGTLFVGSRNAGKVYAVLDRNHDGKADEVIVIAEGLNSPNGVAFHKGSLYVAEINRILRYDRIEWLVHKPPEPVVISTDFPSDAMHGWKFIRIGPDNKLYVPIGAPCNVCIEYGYAAITRLELDGSRHEIFAEGVRNSVGFDWHPVSKELWFTDNGRDQMGDDLPPDELNRAPKRGMHFGFPYCHGGDVLDPEYGLGHRCREYVPPVQKLGAHVAALGMRFYTGKQFPVYYRQQVIIAEHGSWNRSSKVGYRLSLVRLEKNKAVSYTPFIEGWLEGESAWGRPVDVEVMADGSLLISDDKAGAIYRVTYHGDRSTNTAPAMVRPKPASTPLKQQARPASVPDPLAPVTQPATAKPVTPNEQRQPPSDVLQRQEQRSVDHPANDPFSAVESRQINKSPAADETIPSPD